MAEMFVHGHVRNAVMWMPDPYGLHNCIGSDFLKTYKHFAHMGFGFSFRQNGQFVRSLITNHFSHFPLWIARLLQCKSSVFMEKEKKKYVKLKIKCNLYWKEQFLISTEILLRAIGVLMTDADHQENLIYYLDMSFWWS